MDGVSGLSTNVVSISDDASGEYFAGEVEGDATSVSVVLRRGVDLVTGEDLASVSGMVFWEAIDDLDCLKERRPEVV